MGVWVMRTKGNELVKGHWRHESPAYARRVYLVGCNPNTTGYSFSHVTQMTRVKLDGVAETGYGICTLMVRPSGQIGK